jgi:hypothetical protein
MADELNPEHALIPLRQQTVEFYGDHLLAAEGPDATVWVPIRPICEALGLDWPSQYQRLKRDPVLRARQGVVVITTPGGEQPTLALPLKLLPGWLFGIQASRVKPELREKILRYQEDCYEALWNAFKSDILPAAGAPRDLSGAALALEIGEAITTLARQQLELEGRFTTMADYTRGFIQQARRQIADHEDRLSTLELRLDPAATITEEQAAELALAVKHVGQRLVGQGDKSGYARVYSEMYRRYRISSYKNLPRARYDEVLAWLHGWYEELGGIGST